jgi:hypothetical protein
MPTLDPRTISPDRLATMLRAWASGMYASEAAVDLLIAHGTWLARRDFRQALVDAVDDGWSRGGDLEPMASIDWDAVTDFLERPDVSASSSEVTILRLAASMAGSRGPASLLEITASLDDTNSRLVLDALAHRFGWHERGTTYTVTGHVGRADQLDHVAPQRIGGHP